MFHPLHLLAQAPSLLGMSWPPPVEALIDQQLRQVAARLMHRERTDHTLSPTAVVHEAVIRLLGDAVFDKSRDLDNFFEYCTGVVRRRPAAQ